MEVAGEGADAADLVEVSDGEIMDGDEPKDVVVMNKMQQMAMEALRSKQRHEERAVESALASKVKANPEEESKDGSNSASRLAAGVNPEIEGLSDDMVCTICCNARRSVMIQTCKHLVFCTQCDKDFKLKNYMNMECPICRKEFKKTLQVLFS